MRVGSRCGVPQREKYSVELLFIVFGLQLYDCVGSERLANDEF